MMQQAAIATWQPARTPAVGAALRWSALAFASMAVPVAIVAAALSQAAAPAAVAVPPIEAALPAAVQAPRDDTTAPALPSYYSFNWADECESDCPGRGEF